MRLKQLLGVIFLTLIASATGLAANSQLTNVNVTGEGRTTTVLLHANGAFTHTEYRPVDNLLLVDLAGVTAGNLKDTQHAIHKPGVDSYRVLGYKGANGAEVTRVEIALEPGAVVNVSPVPGALEVRVSGSTAAAAVTPVAATEPAARPAPERPAEQTEKTAPATASTRRVQVKHIAVVRAKSGLEVEVRSTGPVTPKVTRLSSPDRLVVDLPNAVPIGVRRETIVNGPEVKAIRVGRFQENPPVTRIVVDLNSPQDYVVGMSGNNLSLRLRSTTAQAEQPAAPVMAAEKTPAPVEKPVVPVQKPAVAVTKSAEPVAIAKAVTPAPQQKPSAAQELVVVQPQFHATTPTADKQADPKAVADEAARIMRASTPTAPQALAPITSATMAQPVAENLAAEQQKSAAARPMQTGATQYTGEPISVNLKDVDLKDFFRLIHEISGLNIILDPNVKGTLTLVLDDVPWDQALDIVLQNNGLSKRLEGNVLRIATQETFQREAEAKRSLAEAQALSVEKTEYTHFLSYAHAADVMPIVKKFLSSRGDVVADPRTNALIITDIPQTIPDVQRVLRELDRKTPQVEIEARVVAATRNFARDIGVQLGFGTGNNVMAVGGAGAVGTSPLQVTTPNPLYFVTGNQIPLFSNLGAAGASSGISFSNATKNYRIDAVLTMAESRGLLKILSRPRVVTQNNQQAQVKQGVRIPVVTAAQLGGPPTTTYVEAALRLQVTPQITAEGTIFMQLEVENTTPDFGHQVSCNPSLITQSETTQVLVTDGGTVVIGGVIQTQNSVNIDQVPLLGDIPVLGNLFKRRSVTTTTQELMFIITPKIMES
ncbi:MAG: type IV pilus secretin PilQ [Terriglobales bacterium]